MPLHPKLVHLPLALAVLVPLLSTGVLVAWLRGWFPRRVWVLVALAQVLLVGTGVFSMRTGEEDEERVEYLVSEAALEEHEEAAELFIWSAGFVLALTLLPLLVPGERLARRLALATPVGAVAILGLAVRVGEAGGELIYVHDAGRVYASEHLSAPADRTQRPSRHEEDDDDD